MSMKPIEVCLADTYLCARIKYLGYCISKRRSSTYDIEDGIQELWLAVIKRLPEYTGQGSVTDFAGRLAYSHYGHIISEHGNKAEYLFENADRSDGLPNVSVPDRAIELIEARMTLDDIEASLYKEAWRGWTYRLALSSIKLMREGYTRTETIEKIGVSSMQMKGVMRQARRRARALK